jgi:hypothetical protein
MRNSPVHDRRQTDHAGQRPGRPRSGRQPRPGPRSRRSSADGGQSPFWLSDRHGTSAPFQSNQNRRCCARTTNRRTLPWMSPRRIDPFIMRRPPTAGKTLSGRTPSFVPTSCFFSASLPNIRLHEAFVSATEMTARHWGSQPTDRYIGRIRLRSPTRLVWHPTVGHLER